MCTPRYHSRPRAQDFEPSVRDSGSDRVSDADREQTATTLQSALSPGLLDVSELEQRLERAWAARTRDELAAVTGDLRTWIDRQTRGMRRSHRTWSAWSVVGHPIAVVGIVAALIVALGMLTAIAPVCVIWLVIGAAPWVIRHNRGARGRASRVPSG